jgi:hypothetical protein
MGNRRKIGAISAMPSFIGCPDRQQQRGKPAVFFWQN